MTTRNHNFGNCTANWNGIDLKPGMTAGMPITVARTVPKRTIVPTGSGGIVKVVNPDDSGIITVNIDYSQATHNLLTAAEKTEFVGTFTLYDGDVNRTWYFINAFLITTPDLSLGIEQSSFSWTWYFERQEFTPVNSSINLNVVGG
jgi:hypothetical protein